jgi:hypothetical protein
MARTSRLWQVPNRHARGLSRHHRRCPTRRCLRRVHGFLHRSCSSTAHARVPLNTRRAGRVPCRIRRKPIPLEPAEHLPSFQIEGQSCKRDRVLIATHLAVVYGALRNSQGARTRRDLPLPYPWHRR